MLARGAKHGCVLNVEKNANPGQVDLRAHGILHGDRAGNVPIDVFYMYPTSRILGQQY